VEAIVRATLEDHLLRYAGLQVDRSEAAPLVVAALRDHGRLQLRTEPSDSEIRIERQQRTWPLGRKRFRHTGSVRSTQGRAEVTFSGSRS